MTRSFLTVSFPTTRCIHCCENIKIASGTSNWTRDLHRSTNTHDFSSPWYRDPTILMGFCQAQLETDTSSYKKGWGERTREIEKTIELAPSTPDEALIGLWIIRAALEKGQKKPYEIVLPFLSFWYPLGNPFSLSVPHDWAGLFLGGRRSEKRRDF